MLMDNLIGQEAIKTQIRMQAEFCKKYNSLLPHTLLIASAGYGKSAYSDAIAELLGRPAIHIYCPTIQTEADLWAVLKPNGKWFEPGTCVLVDELHSLSLKVAEQLYTMMETFTLAQNGVVTNVPKFTLIGATTEPHMMSKPLRDRFINQFVFEPYTDADIRCFIENMGAVFVMPSAENRIARICNHTPRLVKAFMRKLHMYAVLNNIDMVTSDKLTEYLTASGFTPDGLTPLEDKYMRILADQKKASLATMANLLGMKQNMVATIIEPVLITRGLLEMGVGGRVITEQGKMLYNGRI